MLRGGTNPTQPWPGLARLCVANKVKTTRTAICTRMRQYDDQCQRPVRLSWGSMIGENLLGRNTPEFSEQSAKLWHGIIDESP